MGTASVAKKITHVDNRAMIILICVAFIATSTPAWPLKSSSALRTIESGIGIMKAMSANKARPIPSHLKSVVLAKPPVLDCSLSFSAIRTKKMS